MMPRKPPAFREVNEVFGRFLSVDETVDKFERRSDDLLPHRAKGGGLFLLGHANIVTQLRIAT